MIVLRVTISETPKGLRISLAPIGRYPATHRETLAAGAFRLLLEPLLRKVAADFHRRFLRMPGQAP